MNGEAMQDLRLRVLRFNDIKRRYAAHEKLSPLELEMLQKGIPAEEYALIVADIRKDRRSAAPSKAARKRTEKAATAAPLDLDAFMTQEHSSQ